MLNWVNDLIQFYCEIIYLIQFYCRIIYLNFYTIFHFGNLTIDFAYWQFYLDKIFYRLHDMKTKFILLSLSIFLFLSFFIAIIRILKSNCCSTKQKKIKTKNENYPDYQTKIECWHKTGSSSPEKDLTNGYHTQQMTKSKRFGKDITHFRRNIQFTQPPPFKCQFVLL